MPRSVEPIANVVGAAERPAARKRLNVIGSLSTSVWKTAINAPHVVPQAIAVTSAKWDPVRSFPASKTLSWEMIAGATSHNLSKMRACCN